MKDAVLAWIIGLVTGGLLMVPYPTCSQEVYNHYDDGSIMSESETFRSTPEGFTSEAPGEYNGLGGTFVNPDGSELAPMGDGRPFEDGSMFLKRDSEGTTQSCMTIDNMTFCN